MALRRLILPIVLSLLLVFGSVAVLTNKIVSKLDQNAIASEAQVIDLLLLEKTEALEKRVIGSAWRDKFFDLVTVKGALDTSLIEEASIEEASIKEVLGELAPGSAKEMILIIGPENQLLYSTASAQLPKVEQILQSSFVAHLNAYPWQGYSTPDVHSGTTVLDDQLALFSAVSIVPATPYRFDASFKGRRQARLIYISFFTETDWAAMGEKARVENIQFNLGETEGFYTVKSPHDDTVGSLVWAPNTPGQKVLRQLSLPVAVFVSFLLGFFTLFFWYAQRLVSELGKANKAKSEFLASMSHEIRTPLNAIIGFSEVLEQELFGPVGHDRNKEYVGLIGQSGRHLLAITNDILDIAKLEADGYKLYVQEILIDDLLKGATHLMAEQAGDKNIKLACTAQPSMLHADKRVLNQIMYNLLSNAIKYTPESGDIRVSGWRTDDSYKISISDTGAGMTEEEIKIARKPFGQIRHGFDVRHEGTGLGLPLVDRFIRLHGGNLDIQSTVGVGTSVIITLPWKNSAAPVKLDQAA